jgi:DNA-binding NtrC family response regulator
MKPVTADQPSRQGNEMILLVEDDPLVCAAVRLALMNLGYRVQEAASGADALAVWGRHHSEIRLALIDLVLAGKISGSKLGKELSRQNPKLKVIYCSGYTSEIAGEGLVLQEGVNFLSKPFAAETLALTVRNALDAS